MKAWPDRVWALEGANGAGRPLAQRLVEAGERVLDVSTKLAARVRLFDTGHNRKTDALDAHSIAVVAGESRRRLAAAQIADLVTVTRNERRITAELKTMVTALVPTLLEVHGVGPVVAARVLADVGDVARFPDRNRFASWTGTAPLDASSGEQIRHRLSRAGNRRLNHMLHIAAIVQLRNDTEGRAYYRR